MKKLSCLTVACLLIVSCAPSTAFTPLSTPTSVSIKPLNPDEEYLIYDALIESSFADNAILIIQSQTNHFCEANPHDFEILEETLPSFDKEIWEDYLKRNNQRHQLENRFAPPGTEVMVVDIDYVDWIFKAENFDEAWHTFHEIHSESYGFITLSRVGVNAKQDKAIVFVQVHCGPTCGSGKYFLLSKIAEAWRVEKIATIFLA